MLKQLKKNVDLTKELMLEKGNLFLKYSSNSNTGLYGFWNESHSTDVVDKRMPINLETQQEKLSHWHRRKIIKGK